MAPALELDMLMRPTRYVTGGLAVEFLAGGNFLTGEIGDFRKAVISFWFRVEQESIDTVTQEYKAWVADVDAAREEGQYPLPQRPRRFLGIIPLMAFGAGDMKAKPTYLSQRMVGAAGPSSQWVWHDGLNCNVADWVLIAGTEQPGGPITAGYVSLDSSEGDRITEDFILDGSYIGVDCTGEYPALSVNVVIDDTANMQGAIPVPVSQSQSEIRTFRGGGICPGAPQTIMTDIGLCYTETFWSISEETITEGNVAEVAGTVPETFRTLPAYPAGACAQGSFVDTGKTYDGPHIDPGQWHHLLLSLDVSKNVDTHGAIALSDSGVSAINPDTEGDRTDSTCEMFIALDDVNLTESELSVYHPGGGGGNKNAVLSVNAMFVANAVNYDTAYSGNEYSRCEGIDASITVTNQLPTYSFSPPQADGSNLRIPAELSEAVKHVEMAELQIFSDVTLDTSSSENRRAFVDEDGLPVSPFGSGDEPSSAEKLLGKKPEIILSGSQDWIDGKNTGTLGSNFSPSGTIQAFEPDPSLHGEQSRMVSGVRLASHRVKAR